MTATTQGALALNSNTPSVFNFGDQSVRLIMIDGEPWFSAADVCAVLNIKNHRDSLMHLDADEKLRVPTSGNGFILEP
jgi:prophage antirepressor-like protein